MQDCQACNVPISRTTGDRLLSNTFSSLRSSVVSHVGLGGRFQGKTQRTLFVSPIISRSGCQSESIREKVGESRCHCTIKSPPSRFLVVLEQRLDVPGVQFSIESGRMYAISPDPSNGGREKMEGV
ncbi:hypothetical protein H106_00589 [Trichophyton rubrum CBS 735.88]|nr:hypothetical protein H106_00589 [Trichophyton rubrum CBS 735.88]